jgi:PAS domain S-box-containing protein
MSGSERTEEPGLGGDKRAPIVRTALAVAVVVFALDTTTRGAVAVLYIAVPLLLALAYSARVVVAASLACAGLSTAVFVVQHWGEDVAGGGYTRLGVSLTALAVTTFLAVRNMSARCLLAEQARILELSHDTLIIRDLDETILYWNDGAEQLYGFSRAEALGRKCSELLQCQFPSEHVEESLEQIGQWSGEMCRTRKDGQRLILAGERQSAGPIDPGAGQSPN